VGEADGREIDLENYVVENQEPQKNFFAGAFNYVKTALVPKAEAKRQPAVNLPKISLGGRWSNFKFGLKNFNVGVKNLWGKLKSFAQYFWRGMKTLTTELTPVKKLFLISLILLAL